jgi:shikimate dehydrogenase
MTYLTEISPVAQAVGAVNTVWRTDSGWAGTNTDITGFLAPLRELSQDWHNTAALILGCGGVARAVVAACRKLGCPEIWVVGRDLDKLQAFQTSWQNSLLPVELQIETWAAMDRLLPQAGLVVNCTPIGMAPLVAASPLSIAQIAKLPSQAVVYDSIYTPRPTRLLELASEQGCLAIDGLEMLIQQGAAALEIWLETPAPVAVMRQALLQRWALPDVNLNV